MEISDSQSTLEILPDEILLEICKYLLCSNILYSFTGLNYRMTRLITEYRRHVSLYKISISKFDALCVNIFPQMGTQICSLVLDCCYSVLEGPLFIEYFGKKMSIVFPNLERISLFAYQPNQVLALIDSLTDMNHLVEIRLYNLFSVQKHDQSAFVQSVFQGNNHRFRTILIDDKSSCLCFNDTDCYLNIVQLHIKLKTIRDLSALFAAVPNVEYLDVIIEDRDLTFREMNNMTLSSLEHLTNFRLKSIKRAWILQDLTTLLVQLPAIRCLSLFLCTMDERLIRDNIILSSLPSTVQQFNYAIYFLSNIVANEHQTIVSSWSSSYPIVCYFNNESLFMHTLPWQFGRMDMLSFVGQVMFFETNTVTSYDRHVEQLYFKIDKTFTYNKSLAALSQCRRVRELHISVVDNGDITKEEKSVISCLPKLSRLIHASFYGSIPSDLNQFLLILNVAPNLFRLDLSLGHLLRLIKDPQICPILSQHITSLCIFGNEFISSTITINEEHIPIIASALSRVDDIYINIMHLPCSTTILSNEDILHGSFLQTSFVESSEYTNDIISSNSSESMLLCILKNFKEHNLIAVCIDGLFVEKIKTDPEQWLRSNTILSKQRFKAIFRHESNRLLIWM